LAEIKQHRNFHSVQDNPSTSTRAIAEKIDTSHQSVWRVLKKTKISPLQNSHIPSVAKRRVAFCRSVMLRLQQNPHLLANVILTDECKFTNSGMFNLHNEHVWSIENSREHQGRPQIRFGLNVWVSLLGDRIIGPYIYQENLTAAGYLQFLRSYLTDYIDENISINSLNDLWFQKDGAPPHNARRVTDYLQELFPQRLIGNDGTIRCPARSPDLSPLDFYLWGTMKDLIYKTVPTDINELCMHIITGLRTKIRRRDVLRTFQNL